MRTLVMAAMVLTNSTLMAKDAGSVDTAAAFGARPSVADLSLSPDGKSIASLTSAGVPHQLVTWNDLDHQLEDSNARAEMLRKSEAFLRQSLGMSSSDARPPQ